MNLQVLIISALIAIMPSIVFAGASLNKWPDMAGDVIIQGLCGTAKDQIRILQDKAYPGEAISPSALTVDSEGSVFIDDPGNSRVMKFGNNGKFVMEIDRDTNIHNSELNTYEVHQQAIVDDLSVDSKGHLYVLSGVLRRIEEYSNEGRLIRYINISEILNNVLQIGNLENINIDNDGNIYILFDSSIVVKLDKLGQVINRIGNDRSDFLQHYPGYFLDINNSLYYSYPNGDVVRYDKNGKLLQSGKCAEVMKFNKRCLNVWRAFEGGYIMAYDYDSRKGGWAFKVVDMAGDEIMDFRDPTMAYYYNVGSPRYNIIDFDKKGNYYQLSIQDDSVFIVNKVTIHK